LLYGLEEVADAELVVGEDALDEGAAGAGAAGDEDLSVEARGGGNDVRLLGESLEERTPVADAVACGAHELYVCECTDEALLEVSAHAIGDGEGDDERSNSGGDSERGDYGYQSGHCVAAGACLTAASPEITRSDKELKSH
jgi:hypothetical protein